MVVVIKVFIRSYYDQVVALESKIPPQEVQVPFKWKDAFDKGSIFGGKISLSTYNARYNAISTATSEYCSCCIVVLRESVPALQHSCVTKLSCRWAKCGERRWAETGS